MAATSVHESQLSYNNCIAVHPHNADFVVCGAVDLHLTKDGGGHWTQISTGQRGDAGDSFPANFVHSDHHAVVIDPAGWIYSANDGGVAVSTDGGKTFEDRSNGMVTAMFYTSDVAQSNSRIFGGGTQDNGTLIAGVPSTKDGTIPPLGEFTRVLSSDGGWIEFDFADDAPRLPARPRRIWTISATGAASRGPRASNLLRGSPFPFHRN